MGKGGTASMNAAARETAVAGANRQEDAKHRQRKLEKKQQEETIKIIWSRATRRESERQQHWPG